MNKIAESLRKRADVMEARIEAKLHPAVASQNPTPRRMQMANAMREEGYRLQTHQAGLRALAERHDAADGDADLRGWYLDKVRYAAQIRLILNQWSKVEHKESAPKFQKMGITTNVQLSNAKLRLEYLIEQQGTDRPSPEAEAIRAKEEALVGVPIPGFFPTPRALIDEMIELSGATTSPPERILEPSAGKGDIAEVLREKFPEADLHTCEINHTLADLLELKGFTVTRGDFLEIKNLPHLYDTIIMNPPFERSEDIDHVRQAYRWLDSGGVMVSVMSAGSFFRQDKKATEFRDWLDMTDHDVVDNDPGAFKKAFRSTGVSTKLVVIRKS